MTYHYELFSQDLSAKLLDTTDKMEVENFLLNNDCDSLPIRVEWGQRTWKERWTGRIDLLDNGYTFMHGDSAYLKYMKWSHHQY